MSKETFDLPVAVNGTPPRVWTLTLTKPERHQIALALADGEGQHWEAHGSNVFGALMKLRLQLEPLNIQICCNGARRNAWSSGMQADMGEGYDTYLLKLGQHGEGPPSVRTLDPASPADVATVAEQRAFYEEWLSELRDEAE